MVPLLFRWGFREDCFLTTVHGGRFMGGARDPEGIMKKHWLGVLLFVVMGVNGGDVPAAPPWIANMEGREVDPMAQTFHLSEVLCGGYVAPDGLTKSVSESSRTKWDEAWELLLWRMSIPLGLASEDSEWFRPI
jgi:hypothetical protein